MIKDYEKKRALLLEKQNCCCAHCGERFERDQKIDLAHKLVDSVANNKVFGKMVIDHILNLGATHRNGYKGRACNDRLVINRSRKLVVADHLEPIYEDLLNDGYDVTELKKQIEDLRK